MADFKFNLKKVSEDDVKDVKKLPTLEEHQQALLDHSEKRRERKAAKADKPTPAVKLEKPPTGFMAVVMPDEGTSIEQLVSNLAVEGTVVGVIEYPLEFCPVQGCIAKDTRHPFSFINLDENDAELWLHTGCGRPTHAWWDGHFARLVQVAKGVKLPWLS